MRDFTARHEAPVPGQPFGLGAERGSQLAHARPEAERDGGSPHRRAAGQPRAARPQASWARLPGSAARATLTSQRSRAWGEGACAG